MLIPQQDASKPSYAADKRAIWRDIEALWRTVRNSGGQGARVFIQSTEPAEARAGDFWFDTTGKS